jgi:hypothetical protein
MGFCSKVSIVFGTDDPKMGEQQEGRVYRIAENWLLSPYNSIKVLWYDRPESNGKWRIQNMQTDCDVSPWDIQVSTLKDKEQPAVDWSKIDQSTPPQTILNQLKSLECAADFKTALPKKKHCPAYYKQIKRPSKCLDVSLLS